MGSSSTPRTPRTTDDLDLLLHPVRLRIVHALAGGAVRTTAELGSVLPDVSTATVYRQVGTLADAGIIEVAGEHRVRGFVERSYRLRTDRAAISASAAATATPDDHRRVFALAAAVLLAEFSAYLQTPDADPVADEVGYRQHAIWLSDGERAAFIQDLRRVLLPRLANGPDDDRRRYLMSPILFPTV